MELAGINVWGVGTRSEEEEDKGDGRRQKGRRKGFNESSELWR